MYLDQIDILDLFDFDEEEYEEIRRSILDSLSSEQSLQDSIVQMP